MIKTKLVYLKIGIPLLLFNVAAMADDTKRFPGSSCQAQSSTNTIAKDDDGSMRNAGGTPQPHVWICPIVRDDFEATVAPEYAEMSVTNGVTCTFRAASKSGTGINITGSSTVGTLLRYGVGDANIPNSHADGYLYFRCTVPLGGKVFSYRTDEDT